MTTYDANGSAHGRDGRFAEQTRNEPSGGTALLPAPETPAPVRGSYLSAESAQALLGAVVDEDLRDYRREGDAGYVRTQAFVSLTLVAALERPGTSMTAARERVHEFAGNPGPTGGPTSPSLDTSPGMTEKQRSRWSDDLAWAALEHHRESRIARNEFEPGPATDEIAADCLARRDGALRALALLNYAEVREGRIANDNEIASVCHDYQHRMAAAANPTDVIYGEPPDA